MHNPPVFKPYEQHQLMLLPPSLEELIAPNHPVRLVNRVIDRLDLESLMSRYHDVGASSYHPRMLLKVLVYGYLSNIYSSRKLEEAVKQNIHFMWLSGMQRPDHHTINRFRSDRLSGALKTIFSQVVLLLVESGQVSLKEIYLDGTKLEANANRYSFVWGKSIQNGKSRIREQLEGLWRYAQGIAQQELAESDPGLSDPIRPEQVEQTIATINEALKGKKIDPKVKQKLRYGKKHWSSKLQEYEQREQHMGSRSNCSKTDPDATFMRMKEGGLNKGLLRPGYNWQICTCNQFILHHSIHQTSADIITLIEHLEGFHAQYQQYPENITADAGYGSEENYHYLDERRIDAFVKYNYFDKQQRKSRGLTTFYNAEQDCFYCPMGQPMKKIRERTRPTSTGFLQKESFYQAVNCNGCPLRGACHKQAENRIIQANHRLTRYKQQAAQKLLSDEGKKRRKKRSVEVEAVFGMIKQNHQFRRFRLRGIEKVEIEAGLVALAHNLKKMAA